MADLIVVEKSAGDGYERIAVCQTWTDVGKIIEKDQDKSVLYRAYKAAEEDGDEQHAV